MPDTAGLLSGDIAPSAEGGVQLLATLAGLRNANLDALSYQPPLVDPTDPKQLAGAALDPRLLQQNAGVALGIGPGVIRGFHGTPHTFEPVEGNPFGEFRNEAIGSGEGAQAYGWGHYVAGNLKVAEDYQRNLSQDEPITTFAGKPIWDHPDVNANNPDIQMAVNELNAVNGKPDKALAQIDKHLEYLAPHVGTGGGAGQFIEQEIERLNGAKQWISDNKDQFGWRQPGHLLEVHIHPDEDQLLDWDKPLSQQSPSVQQALNKMPVELGDALKRHGRGHVSDPAGQDIYDAFANNRQLAGNQFANLPDQEMASVALHEAGIPGIKYLDAGSRTPPQPDTIQGQIDALKQLGPEFKGYTSPNYYNSRLQDLQEQLAKAQAWRPTHNYVIFHPSNLRIVARDGTPLEPVDHDPFAK